MSRLGWDIMELAESLMGFVHVKTLVCNPAQEERCQEAELLVDTGATLSVIPRATLEQVGIRPIGSRKFKAFGGIIERETGVVTIKYLDDTAGITVVFGEGDDTPVLGVTALETLGYRVDPTTGELEPTELLLL